ncbi:hypothetical protein [Saccharopolyspora antimicrobica]|uniref:hypothetical protein n=1 Tax=Saccharopolyspora antimicrobica TaxID=455193 RepID=UPI001476CF2F|nr:hypothetical protein [Saccharopolyspora antimicrobica]
MNEASPGLVRGHRGGFLDLDVSGDVGYEAAASQPEFAGTLGGGGVGRVGHTAKDAPAERDGRRRSL